MIDDFYTDPEVIFAQYRFGPSQMLATEAEQNSSAAVGVSAGGGGGGIGGGGFEPGGGEIIFDPFRRPGLEQPSEF